MTILQITDDFSANRGGTGWGQPSELMRGIVRALGDSTGFIVCLVGFSLLVLGIKFVKHRISIVLVCGLLVAADLVLFGSSIYPGIESAVYLGRNEVFEILADKADGMRVSNRLSIGDVRSVNGGGQFADELATEAIIPYTNQLYPISLVEGQAADRLPQYYRQILRRVTQSDSSYGHFLKLFGVDYVIAERGWIPVAGFEPVYQGTIQGRVGEIEFEVFSGDVNPRAYVTYNWEVFTGQDEILDRLLSPDLDDYSTALLFIEDVNGAIPNPSPGSAPSPILSSDYGLNQVTIAVSPDKPGLLVLNDSFYPGWEVFVDGEKRELLRTNYLVRGVFVDAGYHTIDFRFTPKSLQLGALVSLASGLFILHWVAPEKFRLSPKVGLRVKPESIA